MARVPVAVLISGRGTNLSALAAACRAPDYPAKIVLVVSNVETAKGIAVARGLDIPAKAIPHTAFASREEYDGALDTALSEAGAELVCEAGFMRIHSDGFVRKWEGRLLNIHPSLLPAFKGIRVHQQVLDAGVRVSGCTVHFIAPELDSGPIIAQTAVEVLPGDTPATLSARVLEAEHRLYPNALRMVAEGRARLERGRVVFS
ncbi:MAG: phosphoribosylglycinamide formyltransferase [Alphaproteobacteria bacterium]|nr:phosphoribosylglycinamide formyltransferase [Alphaproteobacteria bacterium]